MYIFYLKITTQKKLSSRYNICLMKLRTKVLAVLIILNCCSSCKSDVHMASIPIISWGGIPADKADTLYCLARECGFDTHLGLYRSMGNAIASMDAAA